MITSLLKTKAPVVAIPVEGGAPLCVDGKRLRAWAKGLTINLVAVKATYPRKLKITGHVGLFTRFRCNIH